MPGNGGDGAAATTVQVAPATLSGRYVSDYLPPPHGAAIATVPLPIVFLVPGRGIIGAIMPGAPR